MTPSERREMKGMIPNVAPQAACVVIEKRIMERIEKGRVEARPKQIQKMPPRVWTI